MPDDSGVVSALRAQRPKRQAPTPRTRERAPATPPQVLPPAEPAPRAIDTSPPLIRPAHEQTHPAADKPKERAALAPSVALAASPDEPTVNFAVRIRRSFDELLSRRIGELRARGVRSSKVEITEMLLAELALAKPDALEQRLATFRRRAPR
jgi:hypothetical protein